MIIFPYISFITVITELILFLTTHEAYFDKTVSTRQCKDCNVKLSHPLCSSSCVAIAVLTKQHSCGLTWVM